MREKFSLRVLLCWTSPNIAPNKCCWLAIGLLLPFQVSIIFMPWSQTQEYGGITYWSNCTMEMMMKIEYHHAIQTHMQEVKEDFLTAKLPSCQCHQCASQFLGNFVCFIITHLAGWDKSGSSEDSSGGSHMVQIILQRILCCILPIILQTAISVASKFILDNHLLLNIVSLAMKS